MSSLCCRSISSRVISESISVNFLIQDSSLPFGRASGPGPPRIDQPRRPGPWRGRAPCFATTIEQIVRLVDYSRWGGCKIKWSIKQL
jgi:hypothetical protein